MSKVKGIQGYYEVNGFRRSLKVDGFKIFNPGVSAFRRSKGFKTCRDIFFDNLTTPHPIA